jgi:PAS domain S-box-containing protein
MKTGKFIDANDKLCEISKYKKDEILGKTVVQLGFYSQDDEIIFTHQMTHAIDINGSEMNFKAKDGSVKNIRFYAAPIKILDKDFFLTEFYDITEQKRLQSQLKQSLKMESIGTMAGGVAMILTTYFM